MIFPSSCSSCSIIFKKIRVRSSLKQDEFVATLWEWEESQANVEGKKKIVLPNCTELTRFLDVISEMSSEEVIRKIWALSSLTMDLKHQNIAVLEFAESITDHNLMVEELNRTKSLLTSSAIKRLSFKRPKQRKMKRRDNINLEQYVRSLKMSDVLEEKARNENDEIFNSTEHSAEYKKNASILTVIENFEEPQKSDIFRNMIKSIIQQDRITRLKIVNPKIQTIEIDDDWIDSIYSYKVVSRRPKEIKSTQNMAERNQENEKSGSKSPITTSTQGR